MGELWVNSFALSLSNPKLIISFARGNNLLGKMAFCHLTQYYRSNMEVDIARILKILTSSAGIKYKFGIQVPKGIKNAIDLDKKSRNQLWQEAIKTELKQLTDCRLSDIHSTKFRGGYSDRLSENSLSYGF
jgi:Ni,Fe-hydrogenase III large subunit